MLKNATYKEKFVALKEWLPAIIDQIKRDLKMEHLKKDALFCKKYLPGINSQKATVEELVEAYTAALKDSEHAEALAEFLSQRWLLKNTEMYEYFEKELSAINPNYTEIELIDLNKSRQIAQGSVKEFGSLRTYLFSVINSVVFAEQVFQELAQQAQTEKKAEEEEAIHYAEKQSLEKMQQQHEQQISRLTDKYEKKLSGLQKKYVQDTELLKKQIAAFQRKLYVHA